MKKTLFAGLIVVTASLCAAFDCLMPDMTKADILDDLCVLGVKGAVCTPEYLFNTVVTNAMYDPTGTNRKRVHGAETDLQAVNGGNGMCNYPVSNIQYLLH